MPVSPNPVMICFVGGRRGRLLLYRDNATVVVVVVYCTTILTVGRRESFLVVPLRLQGAGPGFYRGCSETAPPGRSRVIDKTGRRIERERGKAEGFSSTVVVHVCNAGCALQPGWLV